MRYSRGINLSAIALSLNTGYAQIPKLPATAELHAAVIPAVVFALPASSRNRGAT
ncbi:hypothetical protein [Mycobacterium sp.]|uniref:hypothetical protein n=1 Tax=Mycobacterium sp. TaxID=1785 RepID=UPI003F9C16BD